VLYVCLRPVKRKRVPPNMNGNNNQVNVKDTGSKRKRVRALDNKANNTKQINGSIRNTNRLRGILLKSTHPMQTRLKRKYGVQGSSR
jgi:hypothetical protein